MNLRLGYSIFCLCCLLSAQSQTVDELYFTPVPGLQKNMIYCIAQDKTGYIWLGTEAGVVRYDGKESRTFTIQDGLSDNEILQIREDDKGRLWFLTYNGRLGYYDQGKIYSSAQKPYLQQVSAGSISVGWKQEGDSIWYATRRKAYLFVGEELKGEWMAEDVFPEAANGFSEVIFYSDRFLLVSSRGIYDPVAGRHHYFPSAMQAFPVNKAVIFRDCIYYYSGRFIYRYDALTSRLETFPLPEGDEVHAWQFREKDSSILLTTAHSVYIFQTGTSTFRRMFYLPALSPGYLFEDKQQNIWLGTFHEGVWLHRNLPAHIFQPQTEIGTQEAYSLGLWNRTVYAGYLNGEYFEWKDGKAFWRHSSIPAGLSRSYGFAKLRGQLYSLSGQQLINMETGTSSLIPGSVKALAVRGDTAYVALSFHVAAVPLAALFRGAEAAALYLKKSNTIYDKRAYCLLVEADTVWLGSEEGVSYYTGTGPARLLPGMPPGLRRKVTRILRRNSGQLIVSTAGGGVLVRDEGVWHEMTTAQGLISNNCSSLFIADDSVLWVGTDKGLARIGLTVPPEKWHLSIRNYSQKDGLPSEGINDVLIKEDTVWLATSGGVVNVRQSSLRRFEVPSVLIEEVQVNGQPYDISRPITLSPSENNLRIDFTALSFSVPAYQHFAYRLEGADEKWNYTSSRQIRFPRLSPGDYVFLITAGDPVVDAAPVTRLAFRILPPFWQRPDFILAAVLLCAGLIILLVRWRLRTIHRKNLLERTALQLKKEKAELEQKAAVMQMNPHFLFNALNTIKGYYSSGSRADGDQYTSKFSGLMRRILENNSRPFISLQDEITMLQLYLELMCEQRSRKFSFSLHADLRSAAEHVWIPPMLIQPFVENAVIHGIAPLPAGGQVDIRFTMNDEEEILCCEILDNGIGLERSAALNKFRTHGSKGIEITRQRLRLISDRAELFITELPGAGTGTRVCIRFPVRIKK